MNCILLIDFGSTYTKVSVVDIEKEKIAVTAKAFTTVETDIMTGYKNALKDLGELLDMTRINVQDCLVCSSAAGGLNMIASGLVKELTSEAAKLACLGSGAKILEVYSRELTCEELSDIKEKEPDMILLAGGTDGGNSKCIMHNANLFAQHQLDIPIIVAGNKLAKAKIENLFSTNQMTYQIVDNVMPDLNKLQIEPARAAIREIFMSRIIEAKGLAEVKTTLAQEIIPTPMAVLRAVELLSSGTEFVAGWGPLMVIDIGGATTDIHSMCSGEPTRPGAMQVGLVEPDLKRTVEGDLGMRVSALSLLESVGPKVLMEYSGESREEVEAFCKDLSENTSKVPLNSREDMFDESLAFMAVKTAVERHVGYIESVYSPMGMLFYQNGKDLSSIATVIGTGGALVHGKNASTILKACMYDESKPELLKPLNTKMYLDAKYILSAAGLLSEKYPELSLSIMNKYLVEIGGIKHES